MASAVLSAVASAAADAHQVERGGGMVASADEVACELRAWVCSSFGCAASWALSVTRLNGLETNSAPVPCVAAEVDVVAVASGLFAVGAAAWFDAMAGSADRGDWAHAAPLVLGATTGTSSTICRPHRSHSRTMVAPAIVLVTVVLTVKWWPSRLQTNDGCSVMRRSCAAR